MKRKIASAIALVVGLGLVGTGFAQGRHDDKPHGYDKSKAEFAAKDSSKAEAQPSTGGRHDEKPHGAKKVKSAPKTAAKPNDSKAPVAPAAAPDAAKPAQ